MVSRPHLGSTFLVRIAALPFDQALRISSPRIGRSLETLVAIRERLDNECDAISQQLFELVPAAPTTEIRRSLLNLRRSLHNLRKLQPASIELARSYLPRVAPGASAYVLEVVAYHQELLVLEDLIKHETACADRVLLETLSNESFSKGILTSSRSLFDSATRHWKSQRADELPIRLRRGLLSYFLRTTCKATPFSTLCFLAAGRIIDSPSSHAGLALASLQGHEQVQQSSLVRLNRLILRLVCDGLVRSPTVRSRWPLYTNPTATADATSLRFLARTSGREAFISIEWNPALARLWQLLKTMMPCSLQDLAAGLRNDSQVDATTEEINAYLERLIAIGLLRFVQPVSEQELHWEIKLAEHLDNTVGTDIGLEVAHALRILADLRDRIAKGHVSDRRTAFAEAEVTIRELLTRIGVSNEVVCNLPLFEDASTQARAELGTATLSEIETDCVALIEAILPFSEPRGAQLAMRSYFDSHYASAARIPLLEFYDAFYRFILLPPVDKKSSPKHALEEPTQKALRVLSEMIVGAMRPDCLQEEVVLSDAMLTEATRGLPPWSGRAASFAFFGQLQSISSAAPSPRQRFVLSKPFAFMGFGKYFSRFLPLFSKEVYAAVRSEINQLMGGTAAEVSDNEFFNANLHPSLTDRVIACPGSEGQASEAQVTIDQLYVARCPADRNSLILVQANGDLISPLDLGFLSQRLRPQLYQLISAFGPPLGVPLIIPDRGPRLVGKAPDTPATHYRPRLVYGKHLVLSRRRWSIPIPDFKLIISWTDPKEAMLRLALWRKTFRVPPMTYVRMYPYNRPPASAGGEAPRPANVGNGEQKAEQDGKRDTVRKPHAPPRDAHRPQFCDFTSPVQLQSLAATLAILEDGFVHFEEVLPEPADWVTVQNRQFASEIVLQVHRPATSVWLKP